MLCLVCALLLYRYIRKLQNQVYCAFIFLELHVFMYVHVHEDSVEYDHDIHTSKYVL